MAYYQCPRCYSNDVYFASRQEGSSYYDVDRGLWQTVWGRVRKPLCRSCSEVMDLIYLPGEKWKIRFRELGSGLLRTIIGLIGLSIHGFLFPPETSNGITFLLGLIPVGIFLWGLGSLITWLANVIND